MSRPAPSLTVGNGALGLLATAIPGRADAALSVDIAGSYQLARSGMVMTIGDCGDGRLCARVAALGRLNATRQPNGSLCVSARVGPPFLMRIYSRLEMWEP